MPPTSAAKKAQNAAMYAAKKEVIALKRAVAAILRGVIPYEETKAKYNWGTEQINKIRTLNQRYKGTLEDTHGVNLDKEYAGKTALEPKQFGNVQVVKPVAPPKFNYEQRLAMTPAKGTNTPITCAQIYTLLSGPM